MSDDKTNDPAHHGEHKGNDGSHDEPAEPSSGKHKEKGTGPSDTIAPADDDIIIK